jgi:DUF971 family protein
MGEHVGDCGLERVYDIFVGIRQAHGRGERSVSQQQAERVRIDGHLLWLELCWRAQQGHLEPVLVVTPETTFSEQQTTLERVKWIGRYALAPIWADGHDTGLFTYQRLRELCACEEHGLQDGSS